MKLAPKIIFPLTLLFAAGLAGCSKPGGDPDDAPPAKAGAPDKPGVMIDAATQEHLGLKIESPAPLMFQPQLTTAGRVADPLVFAAEAADYEAARAAATASQSELDRTQKLAAQDNASPRMLEAAQAAAAHDTLALKSAQARFAADWGVQTAARTDLSGFADKLQAGDVSLVKLSLPVGTVLNPPPPTAVILIFNTETNSAPAELADDLQIDPATQVQTLLYGVDQKLPPNIAVTGLLKIAGDPASGVVVPAGAVLRHDGKGWVYVQSDTNQFVRVEVPLDHLTDRGWFMSANLSATNHIITAGAEAVLSAELGGGFNTGTRD